MESNNSLAQRGVDLRRYFVDHDVPRVVAQLRRLADSEPGVTVAPNHVLRGEPRYKGGPGGEPRPIDPMDLGAGRPQGDSATDRRARHRGLVRLDWTGRRWHRSYDPTPTTSTSLDVDGDGILDTEAGHGTFICGLIAQLAPALVIDPGKVLDPTGVGTDFSIALELLETTAPVINLSLGGYTDDDLAPPALEAVLEKLGRDRVVVAAAGNNNSDRPFWPAAFKHVISVGALDTRDPNAVKRACFSNYGSWVDVWAPGVDLRSTYVAGHWLTADEDVDVRRLGEVERYVVLGAHRRRRGRAARRQRWATRRGVRAARLVAVRPRSRPGLLPRDEPRRSLTGGLALSQSQGVAIRIAEPGRACGA